MIDLWSEKFISRDLLYSFFSFYVRANDFNEFWNVRILRAYIFNVLREIYKLVYARANIKPVFEINIRVTYVLYVHISLYVL